MEQEIPEIPNDEVEEFFLQQSTYSKRPPVVIHNIHALSDYTFDENVIFKTDVVFDEINGIPPIIKVRGFAVFIGKVHRLRIIALGKVIFHDEATFTECYSLDDIGVQYCRESSFISLGNIFLKVQSQECFFLAYSKIFAEHATARGGRLSAKDSIQLGNAISLGESKRLILVVGERKALIQKFQIAEKTLEAAVNELENIKKTIEKLVKRQIARKQSPNTPEIESKKVELTRCEEYIAECRNKYEAVRTESSGSPSIGTVKIFGNIGVDVQIDIWNTVRRIETAQSSAEFYLDIDAVRMRRIY